jgi:hypothetical protein
MLRLVRRLLLNRLTLAGLLGAGGWFAWTRRQQHTTPDVQPTWPPLKLVDENPVATATSTASAVSDARGTTVPAPTDGTWVAPEADGSCPISHPFKANDQSKIVHSPGQVAYDRTMAERCYGTVEAAEADGYRSAKR